MDLTGILRASGADAADVETMRQLLDVHKSVSSHNRLLDLYYESEQPTPSIGIDNIPDCVDPGVRCDWAAKAVTSVSERVRLDGFVFEDDYEDEGLSRIVERNHLNDAFNRHVASELVNGCMFATVNRGFDGVDVRMHTAETSAAIWDTARGQIAAGFVVADAKRTKWSPNNPVPVQVNLHLPGRVVVFKRDGAASWNASSLTMPLDRPMMEAFCFRATGLKPFGQTRITKTVRYLVDEVERTLRYMAVSSAFYATPQRYLMGLTDEQYDEMVDNKWKSLIGGMLLSTRDDDGNVPTTGQFAANSPQPYIEAVQAYAKLFSGATGVPLNSLGVVQDNPSSAEAIAASREDVCVAAEDCIESNRISMRNVALMAMAVENNTTIDGLSEEQRSVMPHFRNPSMPNLASTADAMTKIASVMEGFSGTSVFLEGMGFDESERARIRSELTTNQAKDALRTLMSGAVTARQASRPPTQGAVE